MSEEDLKAELERLKVEAEPHRALDQLALHRGRLPSNMRDQVAPDAPHELSLAAAAVDQSQSTLPRIRT